MNWIVLLVIGGVIGWVGSLLMKTDAQMGILGNIIVGIVGSMLGGWLAGRLGVAASGIGVYVVAVIGAVLLIFLLKVLGVFR
jgi:uncharacterized membrane protein YeaQ/YmgE (transglycosylase-associated protein family)